MEGCKGQFHSGKGYHEHFLRCHATKQLLWPLVKTTITIDPITSDETTEEEEQNDNSTSHPGTSSEMRKGEEENVCTHIQLS